MPRARGSSGAADSNNGASHSGTPQKLNLRKEKGLEMKWYVDVLKKYAVFNGRARRKEYWMFVLINVLISAALGFVGGLIGLSIIGSIYSLAVLVPSIAVGVRRMHDTDHSGWFLLIPFYNLYLAVTDGQRSENRFGSDPKSA